MQLFVTDDKKDTTMTISYPEILSQVREVLRQALSQGNMIKSHKEIV